MRHPFTRKLVLRLDTWICFFEIEVNLKIFAERAVKKRTKKNIP